MSRPPRLSLRDSSLPLRAAPMPGATAPLDILPLASEGDSFVILGRFPAGFERAVAGGYLVAEEFLVLDGSLELEGSVVGSATLCFVPAHHVRAPMRSRDGCTVLAWFSGPAIFRDPDRLSPPPASGMRAVELRQGTAGHVLRTTEAEWTVVTRPPAGGWGAPVDVVDLALTEWVHVLPGTAAELPRGPLLVRDGRPGGAR